ncbi:MAG: NrdH-redoxin [Chloroflexi bacterium]|nr:MAG: NrdH-redoxin [Chloroflexota bacterium]
MSEAMPQLGDSQRVRLYSAPLCYTCRQAKEFLQQQGVAYQEIDISKDFAAARELVAKTGAQRVPVMEVGRQIILGFDRHQLIHLLDLS